MISLAERGRLIGRLEEVTGRRLPSVYRQALLHVETSELHWGKGWHAGAFYAVDPIYGDDEEPTTYLFEYDLLDHCERFDDPCFGKAQAALPVSDNGGGDYLVMLGERDGHWGPATYYWSHQTDSLTLQADDIAEIVRVVPNDRSLH